MRTVLAIIIILCLFMFLEVIGLCSVYAVCRLLALMRLRDWVFPTWLIGVPVAFIIAIYLTVVIVRQFK
jgi:hypothetical protein